MEDDLTNNITDCALVFEGGGYRAAYTAAIANALLREGLYFDFVCGLSAGASHAVDYVSRDQHRVKEAFMGRDGNERIGGVRSLLRGKGYFNADYLYAGCIDDGRLPFDFATFSRNPARVSIQAFERDTGRTVVFTKDDMPDVHQMIDRVRASSTLPMLMKPLPIEGTTYLDGGLGEGAGIPVRMAEQAGFDRFVLVATRPVGYRKTEPTARERRMIVRFGKSHPYVRNALLTRWERYNEELDRVERLEGEGRCLVVRPNTMPVKSTTLDSTQLEAAYQLGAAQAQREIPRIKEFLFPSS